MAEGGQVDDFQGCDADFDIKCSPCGEDNIREEAVRYCPECHEYLCATCTRHHGRLKATRSHRLQYTDDGKHGPVVTTKCLYHPDRDIEMHCSTHDMVYCAMCIATEHRSYSGVNKPEDDQLCIQDTKVKNLIDETKHVHECMKTIAVEKQNNIDALKEQRQTIQQNVIEAERSIIEHTRKLKRELLESLDRDYAKIKAELESEISTATIMIQDFEKTTKQLQVVANASPRQQFVQMKLVKKAIADANNFHKTSESRGVKAFYFTQNLELKNSVMNATALGQVSIKAVERKRSATPIGYKMKLIKKINVHMTNDTTPCSISDVCQLEDGTVLLTDQSNKKVKRLDTNYNIKDQCDLESAPMGICEINSSEVAVKMSSNIIQFISVGVSLSRTRHISIVGGDNWGIKCCAGELWVSRCDGVNVYNTFGDLIKSIDENEYDIDIFQTNYIQHMAVSDDTVIVTDQGEGAVCLNRDGTVRRELRDGRLKITIGVCIAEDGTVFLSGFLSENIVMFSSDGRCLGELVSRDAGLGNPISLCYDRNKHCLVVACDNCNCIQIVELN